MSLLNVVIACPICRGRHTYSIAVETSVTIRMYTAVPDRRIEMRLFTCPVKSEDFQAEVLMPGR